MSTTGPTAEYVVTGMTCDHCVLSVTEEVAGVTAVDVDLATGRLVVTGEAAPDAVRAAVAEAGYEVTGS